ncbi:MAG: DUF3667 domain-containing protein [Chitinophagaceae bacterium]
MSSTNCLNCGLHLAQGMQYCPACGQKTDTHRITIKHIVHEIVHVITHADKGIFHLLKALAVHPGKVAREYLAGKHKTYFNPFTFFILCMGLFVLVNVKFTPAAKSPTPDAGVLARIPSEAGRANYITMMTRVSDVTTLMTKHGNVMAMIAIPFLSLITWLAFRKQRYNYAEHLTANVFFVPFANLLFMLLVRPFSSMARHAGANGILVAAGMLLQVLYFSWSFYTMLGFRSTAKIFKTFTVSLFSVLLWGMLVMLFMAIYIYRSWDFYQFFTRMFGS